MGNGKWEMGRGEVRGRLRLRVGVGVGVRGGRIIFCTLTCHVFLRCRRHHGNSRWFSRALRGDTTGKRPQATLHPTVKMRACVLRPVRADEFNLRPVPRSLDLEPVTKPTAPLSGLGRVACSMEFCDSFLSCLSLRFQRCEQHLAEFDFRTFGLQRDSSLGRRAVGAMIN